MGWQDDPVAGQQQPAWANDPVVQAGSVLREIPRQLGLTGRHLLEGAGQTLDVLANPIRAGENYLARAIQGPNAPQAIPYQQVAAQGASAVGLPEPQTPTERVVGDASRNLVGTALLSGGGALASELPGMAGKLATSLAAAPASQGAAAVGSGLAGGSVREAGGGPLEQFAASIGGGLAGGLAQSAASGLYDKGAATVSRIADLLKPDPMKVERTVREALERGGLNWDAMSGTAKTALLGDAESLVHSGQELSPDAIVRLAHYRNIGATPLLGDITQDPSLLTYQRNLTKQIANSKQGQQAGSLPNIENANANRVISTLQGETPSAADAYQTGQMAIGAVRSEDAALKASENALYAGARDSAGRAIPLDRSAFLQDAYAKLDNIGRAPFLPGEVRQILNGLSEGKGQFDVNSIDNLKTILASASRASNDGNVKAAISAVRDALENVKPQPVQTGSTLPATVEQAAALRGAQPASEEALASFDKARAFARSRREWQESAPFIEDALDPATQPDTFVQKHVINGSVDELEKLAKFAKNDSNLGDAIKSQFIRYIQKQGGVQEDVTKFGQKAMNDAFDRIGERKLSLFFAPQEIGQVKSALAVAKYSQVQPIGTAVNNSSTGAMLLGRVADLLSVAKPVPVLGPLVTENLENAMRGGQLSLNARALKNLSDALAKQQAPSPYALPTAPLLLAALSGMPGGQ